MCPATTRATRDRRRRSAACPAARSQPTPARRERQGGIAGPLEGDGKPLIHHPADHARLGTSTIRFGQQPRHRRRDHGAVHVTARPTPKRPAPESVRADGHVASPPELTTHDDRPRGPPAAHLDGEPNPVPAAGRERLSIRYRGERIDGHATKGQADRGNRRGGGVPLAGRPPGVGPVEEPAGPRALLHAPVPRTTSRSACRRARRHQDLPKSVRPATDRHRGGRSPSPAGRPPPGGSGGGTARPSPPGSPAGRCRASR
jgi:hypothetical protein